jgi:hypothetical protein
VANRNDIEGVTILKRPTNIFNIPDTELRDFVDKARRLIEVGERENWSAKHRGYQAKGIVGEYKALRRGMRTLFPGSTIIAVPTRKNGVDILDVLLRTPDGSFVIIESKFQTAGGRIKYGRTNGFLFLADDTGNVHQIPVKGQNKQLSRQWIQDRIDEITAAANHIGDEAERKRVRRLGKQMRQSLAEGRIIAIGMVTDARGHLVFEDDRTRDLRRALADEPESEKALSKKARSTSVDDRATGGRGLPYDANDRLRPASAPDFDSRRRNGAALRPANVRTRSGRLAVGFDKLTKHKPGFTGTVILEVAKIALFSVLTSKLERVNRDTIIRLYNAKVYRPFVQKHVEEAIEGAKTGDWYKAHPGFNKRYVYILHRYEVRMHQEVETLADAVVIIFNGFEIPETVESLDAVRPDALDFLDKENEASSTIRVDKRRQTDQKDVVKYHHTRITLVHSPVVWNLWKKLDEQRNILIDRLNGLVRGVVRAGGGAWVESTGQQLADMINEFQFSKAQFFVETASIFLSAHKRALDDFTATLRHADSMLGLANYMTPDSRGLLVAYLGADPFPSRNRLRETNEEIRIQRRMSQLPDINVH